MTSKRDRVDKMPAGEPYVTRPSELFERVCCDCGLTHSEQIIVRASHGRDRIVAYSARADAATETWRKRMRLADWESLRRVANAHIRRLRNKEK